MTDTAQNNKRIAKNTLLLYIRMLFIMLVSLFTSRINLQSLGIEDFGIYNVVGGVVAMFSVFSGSLATAISRFITFELGKGDKERLIKVFSTAVSIQILLAISIVILAEIIGVWFLNNKMIIPENRLDAANWVLQLSIFSFAVNLISVPYNASIIAHEKMSAFAYISIFEVVMKLIICYSLFVSPIDKLITYSILLFLLSISVRLIYGIYCKKHFEECSYHMIIDTPLLKNITGFAGWSMFGLVAYTCYNQGLNILLNLFFGPVVNAARGVAVQVQQAIQGFSQNFQIAVNPQIIKSYATKDLERLYNLIYSSSKFSYFLLLILSLPIIIKTDYILSLWLGKYPDYASLFIRLILCIITFDSLGASISTAQQATGKIKLYQIVVGGGMLLILPLSYVALKLGGSPESPYIIYLIMVIICHILRMIIIKRMIGLSLIIYCKKVIFRIMLITFLAVIILLSINKILDNSFISLIILCISSIVTVSISVYLFGLSNEERRFIDKKISTLLKHK